MAGRLVKYVIVACVTVLFAVMWGLTIRANLPEPGGPMFRPDYDRLLPEGQNERRELWDLYFGVFRVGQLELEVTREQDGNLVLHTSVHVDVGAATQIITGKSGGFDLDIEARVSPLRGLVSFHATSDALDLQMLGTARGKELFLVANMGSKRVRTSLPFDQNRVMGDLFSPLAALPELSDGKIGSVSSVELFNPLSGNIQEVTMSVAGARTVALEGKDVRVYLIRAATERSYWNSWVTKDGDILIQGTPYGLRLQKHGLAPDVAAELLEAARTGAPSAGQVSAESR